MAGMIKGISAAVATAGKLGHIQSAENAGGDSVFQVRRGVGKWLVHIIKWHTNKTYRKTVIQQRHEVLAVLENISRAEQSTYLASSKERQIHQLKQHIEHGSTFQRQAMDLLGVTGSSGKSRCCACRWLQRAAFQRIRDKQ